VGSISTEDLTDRVEVRKSGDQSMRFLVISYPAMNIKDLEKNFASMDFHQDSGS